MSLPSPLPQWHVGQPKFSLGEQLSAIVSLPRDLYAKLRSGRTPRSVTLEADDGRQFEILLDRSHAPISSTMRKSLIVTGWLTTEPRFMFRLEFYARYAGRVVVKVIATPPGV